MSETGALVDGGFTWAAAINGAGLIAGGGDTPDGQFRAARLRKLGHRG